MAGINGFGHLALKVQDLAASLDFYRDRLGLPEMTRLINDKGEAWIVYLRITDTSFLELFPSGHSGRAADEAAVGVNHICFSIDDIEATAARFAAAGVLLTSPIQTGLDGNRGAWIEDHEGNRIELMEMAPDCLQYRAISALPRGH
jgi:lactoylglutathione lyase